MVATNTEFNKLLRELIAYIRETPEEELLKATGIEKYQTPFGVLLIKNPAMPPDEAFIVSGANVVKFYKATE